MDKTVTIKQFCVYSGFVNTIHEGMIIVSGMFDMEDMTYEKKEILRKIYKVHIKNFNDNFNLILVSKFTSLYVWEQRTEYSEYSVGVGEWDDLLLKELPEGGQPTILLDSQPAGSKYKLT